MKRKNFSLVWGRKLFFGIAWPILILIALSFVIKSGLPESVLSIVLLLAQLISQTGMVILLGYFFLYYPVVFIIPTYYLSRIWAMIILNAIIAVTLVDAYSYFSYGIHLNLFVMEHLKLVVEALEWKAYLALIPLLVLTVYMWMRGNRIWVLMQRKFMNTTSNWYVWLILISFVTTQGISVYQQVNYSKHVKKVLEQFPIRIPIPKIAVLSNEWAKKNLPEDKNIEIPKFKTYYPQGLACKPNKNFIFIVYQDFPETAHHFKEHGINLPHHISAKALPQTSLNSLLYSFPGSEEKNLEESQIIRTLKDYEFHLEFFTTNPDLKIDGIQNSRKMSEARSWMKVYLESSSTKNFATFFYIDGANSYEKVINELIIDLDKNKLVEDTVIVFTALNGEEKTKDLVKVPLIVLWNDHEMSEIKKMTTQYDVMPTMIKEGMNCKADDQRFSFGNDIFNTKSPNYFVYTKDHDPMIWVADKNLSFSLKNLDYFSKDLNAKKILELREFYYNFLK